MTCGRELSSLVRCRSTIQSLILRSSTGMGSFIARYGVASSRKLIAGALARTHP